MARLLREMATNFNDAEQEDEPFRQVLVATHSPLFASQPEVIDALLLALVPTSMHSKTLPPLRVTRMVPVITPNTLFNISTDGERNRAIEAYTIDMTRNYLSHETLDEALSQLSEARTQLNER